MPYGYAYGGTGVQGGGGMAAASPYLQLALQLVQGLGKPGAGEGLASRISDMGAARGINVDTGGAPGILDPKRQAAMQVGETALNAVPVVGGVASALASGARASKTAGAQQDYMQHIFRANPELFKQGDTQFQSEFVPEHNFLANYAAGQPHSQQNAMGKFTETLNNSQNEAYRIEPVGALVSEGVRKIGNIVGGSKAKQQQREEELHAANIKKAKGAQETLRVNAQDTMARRMAMGNAQAGGQQAAQQAALAQLLGRGFVQPGQGPQPLPPGQSPFQARNYSGGV